MLTMEFQILRFFSNYGHAMKARQKNVTVTVRRLTHRSFYWITIFVLFFWCVLLVIYFKEQPKALFLLLKVRIEHETILYRGLLLDRHSSVLEYYINILVIWTLQLIGQTLLIVT